MAGRRIYAGYYQCYDGKVIYVVSLDEDAAIEDLEEDGFRDYQQSATYYAYAKDLCENYNFDLCKHRFCVNQKVCRDH